ncbi:MAG TPA: GGDEF domain-containing protein [Steroidobacteraceae bacterium]|nr:GGDEF domain-containing protein [Steroidobacteraceae bacterium]
MNNTPVKAIAVFDRRESFWFSEKIVDDGSVDCHLIDIEEFLVDIEKFDRELERFETKQLDVVLLDSTLPPAFSAKMVARLRDRAPNLPVLLLPQINNKIDAAKILATNLHRSSVTAAETMTKAIRYARNRQRLQMKLLQLAIKDELTGLHNRRGFQILAKQHLKLAHTMKRQLLMFFADVDGLKQINDRFGHREGDRALIRTATSFKKTFRRSDVTARLSGDEFVALIVEEPERNEETIRHRLQLNLMRRAVKESRYRLSLSIGVARFDPQAASSLQDLMERADEALYAQKRKGLILAQPNATIALANVKQRRRLKNLRAGANRLSTLNERGALPASIVRQLRTNETLQEREVG